MLHKDNREVLADDWLSRVAFDESVPTYTSQRGEDRILQRLFAVIGDTNRWCVEFGATDGKHWSNTWYWINRQGWQSVQIEAARDEHLSLKVKRRDSFDALAARYQKNDKVICLNRWVGVQGKDALDEVLSSTSVPRDLDLMSIDVDGPDYAIWESLIHYQPRVVVIEHNKTVPIEIPWHSDRGSGLLALAQLGKQKGYELVAANDRNGVFVTSALFGQLGINDNSPAKLWAGHQEYRTTLTVQPDGTPVFTGPNRLRWVRGVNGTLSGQVRGGRLLWQAGDDNTSGSVRAANGVRVHASGLVRKWYYSLS